MTEDTISRDGTRIAYERSGAGPALILVDGALCSRGFGPSAKLLRELETAFTVYRYDRRGRGESDDTQPMTRPGKWRIAGSRQDQLAGQTHNVNARVLAVAVRGFLSGAHALHHHS
jgi:pimeloyl-ACP methyl ester carboxylesterase